MPRYPGFIGGSATVRSRNANAEQTVNWYPEQIPGTGKVPAYLVPTPGLTPFTVLTAGPVRALFAQNGRAFAVGGAVFYELLASGNALIRGGVALDGRPATISSNGTNGHQLFITSGGLGYIYSLTDDTLEQITDPGFPVPVAMGAFSDGYFLALKDKSNQFQVSALLDGLTWDSLDVAQVSTVSDHVVALVESHRDIYLFGSQTSSVWTNIGDGDFPYAPIPSVKIDQGCAAAFSVVGLDNSLFWLGQSVHGDRVVWKLNGYTPERISTHAVEFALAQAQRIDDAIAYGYQEDGHTFYVLYVPDLANRRPYGTTWVYDVATQLWHERALWDSVAMAWQPHLSRCHAFGFGRHLVGDRTSPAIYTMRIGLATDGQVVTGLVPTIVQRATPYASLEADTEHAHSFTEDVTRGHRLVMRAASSPYTSSDTIAITDTLGSVWSVAVRESAAGPGIVIATAIAAASGPCTVTVTLGASWQWSMGLVEVRHGERMLSVGATDLTDVSTITGGLTASLPSGTLILAGATTGESPTTGPQAVAPFVEDYAISLDNEDGQALAGEVYTTRVAGVRNPTWSITAGSDGGGAAIALHPGRLTPIPTAPVPPTAPSEEEEPPLPPVDPGGDPDVDPPPPPTDPTPTEPGDLALADLTYLGSANAELDGFSYQEGQVAVRYVEGQRRLLMVKALRGDLVEVTLPTLSGDITTASNITVVRSWANWQWTPTGEDLAQLANGWHIGQNMWVDEDDTDVLWYTIWPEYFGSPTYPLPILAAVRLHDDGTVTKYGPWYYRDTTSAGWKKVCMRIVPIPDELRATFGGRKVCLTASVLGASGGSETNWGPGGYAVHLPALDSTDPIEAGIAIADYSPHAGLGWPYYHCFRDNDYTSTGSASLPQSEAEHGYWQASSDKAWPAVWLAGDKKGFLHIGQLAHGESWYGLYDRILGPNGTYSPGIPIGPDTMQSPAGSSAFYSSDWRPAAWIFPHSDLVERAAGTRAKHSYGMQPRLIAEDWPTLWPNVHRPSGWPYVSFSEGFAFDAVTRQLIWVHPFARSVGFGRYPEIHVFQLPS